MKFGFDWPSSFGEDVWKWWTTMDARTREPAYTEPKGSGELKTNLLKSTIATTSTISHPHPIFSPSSNSIYFTQSVIPYIKLHPIPKHTFPSSPTPPLAAPFSTSPNFPSPTPRPQPLPSGSSSSSSSFSWVRYTFKNWANAPSWLNRSSYDPYSEILPSTITTILSTIGNQWTPWVTNTLV